MKPLEAKYSPGPWSVAKKSKLTGAVVAEDGEMVCDPTGAGRYEDEAEANARLIASAPEMYALLGRVEDYFKNRRLYGYGVEESVSSDLLAKIQEAIKVVDGKNQ